MKFDRQEMKVEVVRGSCGFFCSACRLMCSDEERVWWRCDTLYFGSLAIDDGSCDGLRGRVDFAVVMKCEEGHERSRSLPYGKEIRLGVKLRMQRNLFLRERAPKRLQITTELGSNPRP